MPTASLIKVPVLVSLYQAVHQGLISLTDRIRYREDQRCLGSGVLIHLTPGVEMAVRDAAVLMIIISDNVATNMMIDLVGLEQVNETMRRLGLDKTMLFQRLGDTKAGLDARKMSVSTGREMARLLELIARHQAVSPEASEDMLRIMRRQDYRHELSRLLPLERAEQARQPQGELGRRKGWLVPERHPRVRRHLPRAAGDLRPGIVLRRWYEPRLWPKCGRQ